MIPMLCAVLAVSCSGLPTAVPPTAVPVAVPAAAAGDIAGPARRSITASEAAALAVDNSFELRAERDGLELREGAWRLGFRSYLPSLDLGAGTDERLSMYGGDSVARTVSASLSQLLWDGGRLALVRRLEAAELVVARSALDRASRDRGEAAVSAYRSVVAARARLAIERSSLEAAGVERGILAVEIGLGLARASDLMEADLRLLDMELDAAESALAVRLAESGLAEILGEADLPELDEELGRRRPALTIDEQLLAAAAVERSPELVIARHGLDRKVAEARAASRAWLPTVSLEAGARLGGTRLPLTRLTWTLGLTAGFSGPWLSGRLGASGGREPPYDSNAATSVSLQPMADPAGALGARNAALAARLEEERYSMAVSKVRRSALAAAAAYRNALRGLEIGISALELAETRLGLVRLQASLGQATRVEAVEAELARADRELDLVDAVASLVAAERSIEVMLDLPPDSLAVFIERYRPAGSPPPSSSGTR